VIKALLYAWLLFFAVAAFQIPHSLSTASSSDPESTTSSNRIAVAAVGDGVTSEISPIAGKAPYYLIFDEKGVFVKSVKNPGQSTGRDSSSGVINLLLKESCKTVIAGTFGGKMRNRLEANHIQYYEREGIVEKTVKAFVKTNLFLGGYPRSFPWGHCRSSYLFCSWRPPSPRE
jgi:predicted Fe-Mo cluster-binding NifX family protein